MADNRRVACQPQLRSAWQRSEGWKHIRTEMNTNRAPSTDKPSTAANGLAFSSRYAGIPNISEWSMWNKEASQTTAGQPVRAVSPAASTPEISAAAAPGLPEHLDGVPRREPERRVVAWVGKSVVLKGELISSEDMSIDGRVEGIIEVREHTLTIGAEAKIHADIAAKMVIVLGYIEGSVTAREKIVLGEHAVVEGDLSAARISVADGAVVRGRIETTAKTVKEPAKHAAKETERELVAV